MFIPFCKQDILPGYKNSRQKFWTKQKSLQNKTKFQNVTLNPDIDQYFNTKDIEIILLGDTNCDDLPEEGKNAVVRNLRNFYSIKQLIKKPTHTTNISSMIIDHFATNRPNFIDESGVKTIGFSDHNLSFDMRKISNKTNNV